VASHPSDSEVQRRAEPELVRAVATALGIPLAMHSLKLVGGGVVQLDGYNQERRVACEAFARIGPLKAGQKRKLGNDILKLLLVERRMSGTWRKVLVIAGEDALASLSGASWQAQAVSEFGVEVFHVPLAAALVAEIKAGQVRQVMTNSIRAEVGPSAATDRGDM
jgi:hypothetical protein